MMENELEEGQNEGPPRKRLLTDPNPKKSFVTASPESTVSSDSSSDRVAKKTRDLPNLSDCHSCAVRINYTNPRERLQPLDSMWRVVLLCKKCTKRVKSSELCPYCFSDVGDDKDCFRCRDCQHSIHKDCVEKFGSGLGFSVCVDCWVPDAVAKSIRARKRKSRKNKESSEPAATLPESRVSVGEELGTKVAAAAEASENALNTAVKAKSGVELAKGVLNAVANTNVAGSSETKVVDDNDLDLMLHKACYSRRCASKKTSLMNSGSLGVPLIFYSRRRGLRNSVTADNGSNGIECQENVGVICGLDPHRLKYRRVGKCNTRPSFLVKDSNCENGEVSEIGDENANRFLLKYKSCKTPVCLST